MIDVEAYIVFLAAVFFTVLFFEETHRRGEFETMTSAFAGFCWQALSLLWIPLVASAPSYQTYAVAFLFQGISIVFIVVTLMSVWNWWKIHKWGDEVGED